MGVGNYGSAAGKKPKKSSSKKGRHGVGGFIGNLVGDVEDAGAGLIPGFVNVGKAAVHDAKHAVTGRGGSYKLDDIGKAIGHSYTDEGTVWGEGGRAVAALLRGDMVALKRHRDASNHALYDHPFGPIMDIASVATLGGAAEGKVAQVLAKSSEVGSATRLRAAAIAGLDPVELTPLRRTIENSTGGSFTKAVKRNPVVRAQHDLFEKYSAANPDGFLGVNGRVSRHVEKTAKRADAHEIATTQAGFRNALAKLHNRLERKAVWIVAGEHDLGKLKETYAVRTRMLQDEEARKVSLGQRHGDPAEIGPGPNHDAGTDLVLYEKPGTGLVIRKPKGDEMLAHDGAAGDDLSHLKTIDRRESLARNRRNLAFVKKRLALLDELDKKGIVANPSKRLIKAAEEARKLSDHTNDSLADLSRGGMADVDAENAMLAQRQAERGTLESRIMRELGVDTPVYKGAIRSHVAIVKDRLDTRGANGAGRWSAPGKLDEAQKNTGYNFLNARDSTNPAMYLHTASNVYEQTARITRHAKLMELGAHVSRAEAKLYPASKYKIVEASSKLRKDMDEVYSILVDAESVMEGTPGYAALKDSLAKSLVNADGTEDMVYVLPNKAYDALVGDFDQSSAFVRKWIDNPTKVWRALTLNLRPAWIVNNYIGQLFLLANAYGVRGLKDYILHSNRFSKRGAAIRELAPEAGDFGWANDPSADLKGFGQSWANDPKLAKRVASKVVTGPASFSRAMGKLNEYLTDNPQRQSAMISAISPYVKQFRKAHPKMSWEDAARHLWENEDFSNEITQRVLDDMVDFSDLSSFERNKIKRAIPFYAWVKGASKIGANTLQTKPWNIAGASALAGVSNAQLRAKYGDDLDPFQLGMVQGPGGRVLMTQALNPFMTAADMASMLAGTVLPGGNAGSQNPLAQFNPVFKSPAEALAKRDFFTGANLDQAGEQSLAGLTWQQAQRSIAQKKLYDEIRGRANGGANRVYDRSATDAVLKYLGIPVRTLHRG